MVHKLKEALGIQEAMDNLSAIIEIDMASPPPIGIIKKQRLVTNEEEFPHGVVQWLSGEGSEQILDVLDATYRGIRNHLQDLYQSREINWESEKTKKGVIAMMAQVVESADKMDRYLAYRFSVPLEQKISEREEFRSLQQFYAKKIAKKFQGESVEEETEFAPSALKDFDAVQKDREYELFYIRSEEGAPYFHADLLRNVKVHVDFETEGKSFEEDPLLQMRAMQDRDLQASARQMLGECHLAIEDFCKIVRKFPDHELARLLSGALIALFLAANPRHLIQNTAGKSCFDYFNDFHFFLRGCLKTIEYQKWIAYAPEKNEKEALFFLNLTHRFCYEFFHRMGGIKQEMIGLIHRCMRKGAEIAHSKLKGETIWNQLLIEDEHLRSLMTKFPNGPFFKTLDLIREEQQEDQVIPFDPIGQGNFPSLLYEIHVKNKRIKVLHLPAPTRQAFINKAEIIAEFRAYLRFLAAQKPQHTHLIVNLQDRTSWKEYARSKAVETMQKNAEFDRTVHVLTLPKDTDFYYQNNEYLNLNRADDFLQALKEQIVSADETGYFFPPAWKSDALRHFVEAILPAIHAHCFDSKNSLTRRNREDFIEIFYQFLVLQAIDVLQPDSVSFSCKDAIDTGAAHAACTYGMIQLAAGKFSSREQIDFFRWLLYAPALLIRERAIDVERFSRAITALETLEENLDHFSFLKTFKIDQ